jgi:hypothetical protein
VVDAIRAAVADSAATLWRLSDADLDVEAASRNPRWGVKPAHFIVDHLLVQHVEKHVGQIRRNVTQYEKRGQSVSDFVFSPAMPAAAPVRPRASASPSAGFSAGRNTGARP